MESSPSRPVIFYCCVCRRAVLIRLQLRTQLIRKHRLVVRDCRSFDGMEDGRFIRVAVRARADNERFVAAVRSVLQEMSVAD